MNSVEDVPVVRANLVVHRQTAIDNYWIDNSWMDNNRWIACLLGFSVYLKVCLNRIRFNAFVQLKHPSQFKSALVAISSPPRQIRSSTFSKTNSLVPFRTSMQFSSPDLFLMVC